MTAKECGTIALMDGEQKPTFTYTPDTPDQAVTPLPPQQSAPLQQVSPQYTAVPPYGTITWTAGEFIAHHKETSWYLILAGGGAVATALTWWIADWVSALFVVFAVTLFGVFASRKPREIPYMLDQSGIGIGQRYYPYADFRSFAVMDEGAFTSITFVPLNRFATFTTIYYDPLDEAQIVEAVSRHLPREVRKRDLIDRLLWRIRF